MRYDNFSIMLMGARSGEGMKVDAILAVSISLIYIFKLKKGIDFDI